MFWSVKREAQGGLKHRPRLHFELRLPGLGLPLPPQDRGPYRRHPGRLHLRSSQGRKLHAFLVLEQLRSVSQVEDSGTKPSRSAWDSRWPRDAGRRSGPGPYPLGPLRAGAVSPPRTCMRGQRCSAITKRMAKNAPPTTTTAALIASTTLQASFIQAPHR